MAFQSELAHIQNAPENPFELFSKWHTTALESVALYSNMMCLATVNKAGELGNRNVLLRKLEEDGFIISTTRDGKKYKDISEIPKASATFIWRNVQDGIEFTRQIRTQCNVKELTPEEYFQSYKTEPFFCKVRSNLCVQSHSVQWEDLKRRHDEIVENAKAKGTENLPMPDSFVGFKLTPYSFDFYYCETNQVADRVFYELENETWKHYHIEA